MTDYDAEGRVQLARFGRLVIANVYFPNGNGVKRDNSRVPFKLAFLRRAVRSLGRRARARAGGYWSWATSTPRTATSTSRAPGRTVNTSGFLPHERAELDRWLPRGWVDTFRRVRVRARALQLVEPARRRRERNIGWRLDYVLACARGDAVRAQRLHPAPRRGSDHCPVGVDLDPAVLAAA